MSDAKPSEIVPTPAAMPRLDDLITRINAAHDEVKNAIQRGAEHAINAGRLLLEAKATVGHGNFLKWIGANCHCRVRTAQLYMTLAEEFPLLEAKSNAQRITHLSLNEAVRMLKEPSKEKSADEKSDTSNEDKKDAVAKAIKKNPLDVLRRAWDAAGENERNMFRRRITNSTAPSG